MEQFFKEIIINAKHLASYKYFLPVTYVVAGFIFGFVLEKILVRRLGRLIQKTRFRFDDFVIRAFKRMGILWFGLVGVYYAVEELGLKRKYTGPIDTILLIIVILSVTVVLARISVGFIRFSLRRMGYPSTTLFANVSYILILTIGVLVALTALDISITPLLTALGVGGLAAALALQDTLSNLFAGIQIIASKTIKPGDYVKLDSGIEGDITDITWRSTSIMSPSNNIVIVPNNKLSSTAVTNLSEPSRDMSVLVPVGVSYTSDLAKVERVTLEVAAQTLKEVPGGIGEFQPLIRYSRLSEYSVNFNVVLRVAHYTDQYLIIHEFIKRLFDRFKAEGIEIPFPTRTLHFTEADRK
jgi:small-conductance mechanosensitive channel